MRLHRRVCATLLLTFAWGQKPKLVIGIVVDQMRADYLRRFVGPKSRGFGRLLQEGLVYWNAHYPYFPTYTGPGHASLYTGTTPAYHGIAANDWWERDLGRSWYCVEDTSVRPVGSDSPKGRRSPRTLLTTTLADELRYACRFQNKTIGIALKDRSAILPIGRSGTLALWFDTGKGLWITSSYYRDTLPAWVVHFNGRRYADSLLQVPWTLRKGVFCTDDSPYEGTLPGEAHPTFPHRPQDYSALTYTPAGNWLTFALARQAIKAEGLGSGPCTDLLSISLSAPDLAGHLFGTESCELQDLYQGLDNLLADFLVYLARRFRPGEVLLFLTADHGAAPTPEVLAEKGFPYGRYPEKDLRTRAEAFLRQALGLTDTARIFDAFLNQSFYFSKHFSAARRREAAILLKEWLLQQPGIVAAWTAGELTGPGGSSYAFLRVQAGYLPSRSGDVVVVYAPGWIEDDYPTGTTHGSIWTYDTHVPLVWWGLLPWSREFYQPVRITQVAPTVAFWLGTPLPSAATDAPLPEVLDAAFSPVQRILEELDRGG